MWLQTCVCLLLSFVTGPGVPSHGFTPAACTSGLMQKHKNESEWWKQQLVDPA
jgi:hypothetical protein